MGKVKSSLAWPEWEQHKQQQERNKMNALDSLNAQKIHWENVRASIFLLLKHHKKFNDVFPRRISILERCLVKSK